MDIDYHGTVNTIKVLLPGMIERGSGHIVNFSSMAGVVGLFGYTAYSGAKFAIKGFTDALRSELKPKGIKVSIVYPPDTDTPQLAWENQYKPFETRELAGSDKPIPASKVAEETLKAVARGRYKVVPSFEAKLIYFVATRLGNWFNPIIDFLVSRATKKKARLDK
jgi:3-dehydrosphinganine reductase